jgi:tetratricopeptide (TPR) repeat protein
MSVALLTIVMISVLTAKVVWESQSPAKTAAMSSTLTSDQKKHDEAMIAKYTEAIKLKPDYAAAYIDRGFARRDLGDPKGAIADYQKAADLYKQQGNTKDYEYALNQIKILQP